MRMGGVSSFVSRATFEDFARQELPGLLRYAVMLTGDRELAQDLVQDVMVKAHSHWRRVAAADHPRLYVKTMLTRAFISWRRRWAVRSIVLSDDVVDGEPTRDHALSIVDRADVWQRLATLPRQQRAVLVLRYYERLTDPEIATMLGCSAGTVRGYASRALTALRLDAESSLHKEPR
jgi:RNA polymerase sigma-70 factor (sigma-E family)